MTFTVTNAANTVLVQFSEPKLIGLYDLRSAVLRTYFLSACTLVTWRSMATISYDRMILYQIGYKMT